MKTLESVFPALTIVRTVPVQAAASFAHPLTSSGKTDYAILLVLKASSKIPQVTHVRLAPSAAPSALIELIVSPAWLVIS